MNFLPPFFRKKKPKKTPKTDLLSTPKTSRQEYSEDFKAFILEPILTPSALIDGGEDAPDPTGIDGGDLPFLNALDALEDEPDFVEISAAAIAEPEYLAVDSGYFVVGESGEISVDFVFDGGKYKGEVALFSLREMGEFDPESPEFIQEAARRALSDSDWGRVVISDRSEGAKLDGLLEARNWNRGEYQGEKTFSFQAGDRLGAMLVPNGSLQQVLDNPLVTGAKQPLFSMVTGNPSDSFDGTALVRVGEDGCGFAWEDLSLARGSDRDYNDIVFKVEGASHVGIPAIDDLMDAEMEWRESETGEQILAELNCPGVGEDGEAPVLEVRLGNDTGRSGEDGITFDGEIVGTVTDESGITQLRLSFDGTNFVEITGDLGEDGSFALDSDRLEALLGESLPEGEQTLYFQATDEYGNISEVVTLSFTLDTIVPEIELDLDIASDTGDTGDGATELEIVTLSGRTEPHTFVVLTETGETVTADENGMFAFENVALEVGENEFSVEATDVAGNTNTSEHVFIRVEPDVALGDEIILQELRDGKEQFSDVWQTTFSVTGSPAELVFELSALDFDTRNANGINDAFEAVLVDSEGNSLVHTIGTRQEAFFNITEGLDPDLAPGVTYEGQQVKLDLS
ncbi:MAG: DUF4114 domain-containing protein, partial [Cyanobacteria bacterium SBLK]|nr:DUF4114 domain-containing protein [Cyanobacteria bacterium SBLK]